MIKKKDKRSGTKMIKIIHTSDLHLGQTFNNLGDKSKIHRDDCKNVLSNIITLCQKERVNALLIAGDLFHSEEPSKSLVKFVAGEFERLNEADIPIFISSGNHDPHCEGSVWNTFTFPPNVFIFSSDDLQPLERDGFTIYGLAYTDDTKEPLKVFRAKDSNNFKIGLLHGSTVNVKWDDEPEAGYRKISNADIDNSNLDYIALGHFHNLMDIKTKVKCYYSGCPEPLSYKNDGDRHVLLVAWDNGKVQVKPIKTNIRTFKTIDLDCTDVVDDAKIRSVLEKNKDLNSAVRLELSGTPSLDMSLDIEKLDKDYSQYYFSLKIDDQVHLPENLQEDETIRGQFVKLIRSEIQKETDTEKKKRLENALRIGIANLDTRR